MHKNSYNKVDCLISQIVKTFWVNINTNMPWVIWSNNFINCQNTMNRHKHKSYHDNMKSWWISHNLKTVSDVFCGWRLQTLNQFKGWFTSGTMIQRHRKFCFWFVYVFGLFCCFAGYCKGSLVNLFMWWNAILAAQWKFFISSVNHSSARRLARRFMGSDWTRMGGGYLRSVKEYK